MKQVQKNQLRIDMTSRHALWRKKKGKMRRMTGVGGGVLRSNAFEGGGGYAAHGIKFFWA